VTALLVGSAVAAPATNADTKADFVELFARFIAWPEASAPAEGEPFVVGVVGTGDVATRLHQIAPNRKVRGHAIRMIEVERLRDLERCHIVVLEASATDDLKSILEITATRPILTIGVGSDMAGRGPLITFEDKSGRVGFSIDTEAVARTKLRFSTKLLRLGTGGGR
jgi:hypothetical protein